MIARASRWAIAIWAGALVGCAIVVARTEFTADMSAFLPRSPTPVQQILVQQLRDGVVSRLILIAVEGDAPPALAATSMQIAAELRRHPAHFAAVNNGEAGAQDQDREFLWRNRYVLSPAVTPGRFTAPGLRDALEEDLQLIGSPAGALLARILPQDPTGEMLRLAGQFEGAAQPALREGVWFSPDGTRALLVAQTRAAGYDLDAQEQALTLIRAAFAAGKDAATSAGQRLLVSGPGVFSVNSRARIKADALRFSVIATALVAALLLMLYRSPRVVLLGMVPVASGVLAGVAAVSVGYGTVHGITLGFGVTLIGEAVDYAIYLFTQISQGTPPADSLARIWPTLRLGLLTSICGFAAMLLSGFPGLGQLGLFSIAGLVAAVLVTRYVLPVLLPPGFTVRASAGLGPRVVALADSARLLRWPLMAAACVCIGFLGMQRANLWSDDLASLSPIAVQERGLDEQLRRDIGAPDVRYLVVVDAADADAALAGSEKAAASLAGAVAQGHLAGFDSPAAYLPSEAAQRARQAAIPAPAALRQNLQEAQRGLPFRAGLFDPFLRDAAAAAEQPLLDRASLDGTALALKVDSLLVRRTNPAAATGWTAMLPLRGVADAAAIERELKRLPDNGGVLIDLRRESDALYQTYRSEIVTYSLLGAATIVLLLFASLRSARRVVTVLAPLAAAVIVTLAVLLASGNALTIFHIVGLLLVVAIGSNYALFFERRAADEAERERTLVSLVFANVTTLIGFGLLVFSKVPLLHAIGATVGTGAVLSLVFSAVLMGRPRATLASSA